MASRSKRILSKETLPIVFLRLEYLIKNGGDNIADELPETYLHSDMLGCKWSWNDISLEMLSNCQARRAGLVSAPATFPVSGRWHRPRPR